VMYPKIWCWMSPALGKEVRLPHSEQEF
jgi:hypothetical protein